MRFIGTLLVLTTLTLAASACQAVARPTTETPLELAETTGEPSPLRPTITPVPTITPSPMATATPVPIMAEGAEEIYLPLVNTEATHTANAPLEPTPTRRPKPTPTPERLLLRTDLPALTLPEWPRPVNDNGMCIHLSRNQYPSPEEIDRDIARLQAMKMRWALVLYADENILHMAAPKFAAAGIVPVWRKMLRPYEAYHGGWARDVQIVQQYGLPPYFQLYNEPSLDQEWYERGGKPEWDDFIDNLMDATEEVYNAGGFVGWQFINQEWLDRALDELERRGGEQVLGRFFFVAHSYGNNHPPEYDLDIHSVLGWRFFAQQFQERYGVVPPIIVGEGGWRIGNDQDANFPPIDANMHRDYHVEVFRWFQTGILSNGEPLPDYLFAFCPWLLSAPMDDSAWFDSYAGDRVMTIEAVKRMPAFVRKFSWDQ